MVPSRPSWPTVLLRQRRVETAIQVISTSTGREKVRICTGDFIAINKLLSSTSFTSERKKYFNEGYKMHQTSLGGRCLAAAARKPAAPYRYLVSVRILIRLLWYKPCLIQIFGWYKKPSVALMSSQIFIFWNKPSSQRLVRAESTFATIVSSTSNETQLRNVPL